MGLCAAESVESPQERENHQAMVLLWYQALPMALRIRPGNRRVHGSSEAYEPCVEFRRIRKDCSQSDSLRGWSETLPTLDSCYDSRLAPRLNVVVLTVQMFVFGEVQDPLPETVKLVEDVVRGQIIEIVSAPLLLPSS